MNEAKRPLQDEAERRSEWRGDDNPPRSEPDGHTLPASEDDDERGGTGGGAPASHPGTISPPD